MKRSWTDGAVVGLLIVAAALATGPSEIDIRGLVALIGGDPLLGGLKPACDTPGLLTMRACPSKDEHTCIQTRNECQSSVVGSNTSRCVTSSDGHCVNDADCHAANNQTTTSDCEPN